MKKKRERLPSHRVFDVYKTSYGRTELVLMLYDCVGLYASVKDIAGERDRERGVKKGENKRKINKDRDKERKN